jgi:metallo-beta-lactamase superfamily protein
MVIILRIASTVPALHLRPPKRFLRGPFLPPIMLPMPRASEIEPVAEGLCIWRCYDPSVKADLFATALDTASGTYLIDPIPLAPEAMADLEDRTTVAGIIVTNENHVRAAAEFGERFKAPIYLDTTVASALRGIAPVRANGFPSEMTAIAIEGGPAGEIAIHYEKTIVIGDALINFEPYRFALLPPKYCTDAKLMRRSLAKLLDYSFDRMLFAHGLPILARASDQLELLLHEHR